jgi:hypothetical protein
MSMEGKSSRRIRICTQSMLRLRREVDPLKGRVSMMERSSGLIPLHPPLQSRTMGNPTVRERGYVSYFL